MSNGISQRIRQSQRFAKVELILLGFLLAPWFQRRISLVFIEQLCTIVLEWFRRQISLASRVLTGDGFHFALLLWPIFIRNGRRGRRRRRLIAHFSLIFNRRLFCGRRRRLELGRHLGGYRVRDEGIRVADSPYVNRFSAQTHVRGLP